MTRLKSTKYGREVFKETRHIIEDAGGKISIVEPKSHDPHRRMKIELNGQVRYVSLVSSPKNVSRSIFCTLREFKNIVKELCNGNVS